MTGAIADVVALTPQQSGLWATGAATEEYDPYLVVLRLRLTGPGALDRFREALGTVVGRHPHLGGRVLSAGVPHPVLVVPGAPRFDWSEIDARGAADPGAELQRHAEREQARPLDTIAGPLTRVKAVRLGESEWGILITVHHIVIDGWSIPIFLGEIVAAMANEADELPPAPPIRDHAAWVAAADPGEARDAWRRAFSGFAEMPMVGPAGRPAGAPEVGEVVLGEADTAGLLAFARESGLTANTLMQLAWARILSGLVGRDDVCFGQTVAGRHPSIPGADRMIGGLVSTVPVRVDVGDASPAEAGARLQSVTGALRDADHIGMSDIIKSIGAGDLFDTLLVFENTPRGDAPAHGDDFDCGGGARLGLDRIDSPSHYPLTVVPVIEGGRLVVRVESAPGSGFDPDIMARRFVAVLGRLAGAGSLASVDVLLDSETPIIRGARPDPGPGPETADEALRAIADECPGADAIVDVHGTVDFRGVAELAEAMASGLRAAGVSAGDAVAVMLPRDRRVLAAPFAVAALGAHTIHIDPDSPPQRAAAIIEDSGARHLLAADGVAGRVRACLGEDDPGNAPSSEEDANWRLTTAMPDLSGELRWWGPLRASAGTKAPAPEDPMYAVFTSGTTGRPKGVLVPHRALLNLWRHHGRNILAPLAAELGRQVRVGHGWSTGFDAAWQPGIALLSGATVVMLDGPDRSDPARLVAALRDNAIDVFDTTPSMLAELERAGFFAEGASLSVLALGGEAISRDVWRRLRGMAGLEAINCYGPTETTVEALMAPLSEYPEPTIGRPLDGMAVAVVDHRLRPVPPDGSGELIISGPQLAIGYIGRPELTRRSFVESEGRRWYRTGDIVRRRSGDGLLVFGGRADEQIKINGYRVEPAEAGVVLRSIDGVEAAEVIAHRVGNRMRLAALVVASSPVADIRAEAAKLLPSYLLPSPVVECASIPLNRNGKLDSAAAAAMVREEMARTDGAPSTPEEKAVARCVRAMTGMDVALSSGLADAGIDSLGVMDLIVRLRAEGLDVGAAPALGAADLRSLAAIVRPIAAEPPAPAAGADPGRPIELAPLAARFAVLGGAVESTHSQGLRLRPGISADAAESALRRVIGAHPALGARYDDSGPRARLIPREDPEFVFRIAGSGERDEGGVLDAHHGALDPAAGRMVAATYGGGTEPWLVVTIAHLAVDMMSWRFILEDLALALGGQPPLGEEARGDAPHGPSETEAPGSPFRRVPVPPVGLRHADPRVDRPADVRARHEVLDAATTAAVERAALERGASLRDVLESAVAVAATPDESGMTAITRTTLGRPDGGADRRVGWLTAEEAVLIPAADARGFIAGGGPPPSPTTDPSAVGAVNVNYLGRMDMAMPETRECRLIGQGEFFRRFGAPGHSAVPPCHGAQITAAMDRGPGGPVLGLRFEIDVPAVGEDAAARFRTGVVRALETFAGSAMNEKDEND
ncbi:non-ribosomal peptide synthetase [Corynebacterium freneyi]|uniref:non-ribosomal peptide synthetase n=1 Tax=Corynebacterium freneyi TaxID=134034 RepID=UPI001CCBD2DF|nr:AMP-binding protein [Corynebacterium freneyi]UBI03208.1 AMP-binding protein [Corynebacterium freneyi]